MPALNSAAAVAATISRMLRRAKFRMGGRSDPYHWTEGFIVHRVGVSSSVAIAYRTGIYPGDIAWDSARAREKAEMAKAREFLKGKGYVLTNVDWVECVGE